MSKLFSVHSLLSLVLAAALLLAVAAPVSAEESDTDLLELLEYSTVNNSGSNVFTVKTSATVSLEVPIYTKVRYVDILFDTGAGAPTDVSILYNSQYTSLTVVHVGDYVYRAYGTISGLYNDLMIRFQYGGTASYQLLSCKVGVLSSQLFTASAELYFTCTHNEGYWDQESSISIPGDSDLTNANPCYYISRVHLYDWQNYDSVTIWGSVAGASINSIRATIGTQAVDCEVNFINQADGTVSTRNPSFDVAVNGQYLFAITIDCTQIRKTTAQSAMLIYMTGEHNTATGMTYTFQYVTGEVHLADTSSASWWDRFTGFMKDLFSPESDSTVADDLTEQGEQMQEYEQTHQEVLQDGLPTLQAGANIASYATALAFVGNYTTTVFNALGEYQIIFTLPLVIGLILFLSSRVPGNSKPRKAPPKVPDQETEVTE